MIVYCATTNAGKIREFQKVVGPALAIELLPSLATIPPPEETGSSFEENAVQKAMAYGAHAEGLLFAEDSGLEVNALGGEPGIFSARYSGQDATDESNNRLVLERLGSNPLRTARFVCAIALVRGGELIGSFRGEVEGEILLAPRGSNGFGYDPLFWYPPFQCTFGEVTLERKQEVSHRGKALRQMVGFLLRTS
ncbi:MAG: RdgB/HAM1 family non-canonical purine NTP pyrophosphatase [Bryobacteraceae bacterium]|nr:RdgB/HAM1 family non-canonical purine NTP pyrophosphatase [Bryobacteraceae bacterium]